MMRIVSTQWHITCDFPEQIELRLRRYRRQARPGLGRHYRARQAIAQLHWLTIRGSLPSIIGIASTGGRALPKGALRRCRAQCMTGCPLAGLDADEVLDASPFVSRCGTEISNGNPELYNLPRKFKVSITGCSVWCSYPEINDIGLTPAVRLNGNNREAGFSVRVGGGLSADPHLGVRLNAFVQQHQVAAL